ncbi:MAG: TOBE domain-containing protein [Smithella sp.]
MKVSARNKLKDKVIKVSQGAVNTEIPMKLTGGSQLVSIIFKESAKKLGLKSGKKAYASIKASNVMIAVDQVLGFAASLVLSSFFGSTGIR